VECVFSWFFSGVWCDSFDYQLIMSLFVCPMGWSVGHDGAWRAYVLAYLVMPVENWW
jgi:hypothetical protein